MAAPVSDLDVVRDWLWLHTAQPSGDPWDHDPEHLERAAAELLDTLAGRSNDIRVIHPIGCAP